MQLTRKNYHFSVLLLLANATCAKVKRIHDHREKKKLNCWGVGVVWFKYFAKRVNKKKKCAP